MELKIDLSRCCLSCKYVKLYMHSCNCCGTFNNLECQINKFKDIDLEESDIFKKIINLLYEKKNCFFWEKGVCNEQMG